MADESPKDLGGRPPKLCKPEYAQMLIEHMANGNTFTSFAGQVGVSTELLYTWLQTDARFAEAKKLANPLIEKFMMDMGKMIATGNLRRLKKETPLIGQDGKPMLNPKTGEVLYSREYEPAQGNVAAWICLCRNMLDNWKDRAPAQIIQQTNTAPLLSTGGLPAIEAKYAHLTDAEIEKRYDEMMEKALAMAGKPRKNARS